MTHFVAFCPPHQTFTNVYKYKKVTLKKKKFVIISKLFQIMNYWLLDAKQSLITF